MSRNSYNFKKAVACWMAMLVVLISSVFAIRLEPVVRFDRQILDWFSASHTVALDQFFTYITWAGSSFILLPLIYAIAVIISIRKQIQEAMFLICSFLGASILNIVVKRFYRSPAARPFPGSH